MQGTPIKAGGWMENPEPFSDLPSFSELADGNLLCGACGAIVHPVAPNKDNHKLFHVRFEQGLRLLAKEADFG